MPKPVAQHVYDIYGRFYGGFEWIFRRRLARAIELLRLRPGERVLDIGVGTGLSLPLYPSGVQVVGLDLSEGMLRQAARRLTHGPRPAPTPQLIRGDALNLPFPDRSFDAIFMSHVVATVPEPAIAMREAIRVARDRARIVLVNHFQSTWPGLSWIETAIDPLCRRLGWRTDLALSDILEPLGVTSGGPARGWLFQIVVLQKNGPQLRMADARRLERLAALTALTDIP